MAMARIVKRRAEREATTMLLLQSAAGVKMAAVASVEAEVLLRNGEEGMWGAQAIGATNIKRGECSWHADYLCAESVYPERLFRRRFGVPRRLFWRIHDDLVRDRPDRWGTRIVVGSRTGIKSTVNIMVCMRILRTGNSYDELDNGARMSEETVRVYFQMFIRDMKRIYGTYFLNRRPTVEELAEIVNDYEQAGSPDCGGCFDCMKLLWKNCPLAEKEHYRNRNESKLAMIVAEGWCDRKLYVWSWFVGRSSTNNNLNVLAVSPVVQDIVSCKFYFSISGGYDIIEVGTTRTELYVLGDGIYPDLVIFAKPIHHPEEAAESMYTTRQEAIRKYIERCFVVLQSRWEILRRENRRRDKEEVLVTSEVCIIVHNILVALVHAEDFSVDGDDNIICEMYEDYLDGAQRETSDLEEGVASATDVTEEMYILLDMSTFVENTMIHEFLMTSRTGFASLKKDLVERFARED